MARTLKQERASFERINFETKTTKQASKIITERYLALGRKLPKKLENGNATKKDIARYQQTIRNVYDRKIINNEMKGSNKISKLYVSLSKIQEQRKNVVTGMLEGYDKSFIKGFLHGKKAVLGKNISYEIASTKLPSLLEIHKLAEMNGVKPEKWLKNEIQALQKDLKNLKSANDSSKNSEYIMKEIKNLIEIEGLNFTKENERTLKTKLSTLDFLGVQKLFNIISIKMDNAFYLIYKSALKSFNNRELIESVMSDINKSNKNNLINHVRLIE